MSKGTRNVPALRFKGFSDAWEKRKLGEVLLERNSRSGAKQLLSVTINQGVIKAEDSGRKDNSSSDLSNYKLVKVGDIPYNSMRMWQGASGYSCFEGIVSPAYTVLIPSTETDGLFLSYDIKRNKMLSVFQRHSQGLTSDTWNLKYPQLSSIHVRVPKKNEQIQIRQALTKLDALIAATQDKLEKLSVLQRGFLQHFFAQTWRFSGYSHAWEYYRLGDVATRVRGNDGRMNLPILTISAGKGWLTQEQRFSQNIAGNELKKYTLLSKGELSYNHGNSKLAEYGAVFVLKQFKEALVPRVYHSFNVSGKADPDFIEYLFESGVPNHELRKLISSGARMDGLLNINYDSFMNISVRLPSIEEQNKIARVLEKLKKLTDETRLRLFNLQQAKKSLLRMLFP